MHLQLVEITVSPAQPVKVHTYQWLRYDRDIVDETASTISFSPLREADVGRYNCRVADGSMNITSDSVVINVRGEYSTCMHGFILDAKINVFLPALSVDITSN